MNRAGSVWFWSLLGAFIAAALGTAINLISGVSQVAGRRDGDGSPTTGTTNVYNVQRPQVNVWLVFLILGVAVRCWRPFSWASTSRARSRRPGHRIPP